MCVRVMQVPTFVAQRVPDSHGDYPVLDQAYAVQQWLEQTNIPENVVMMSEPDQLFIRPLPNLMGPEGRPVLYKFGYMAPAAVSAAQSGLRARVRCLLGALYAAPQQ